MKIINYTTRQMLGIVALWWLFFVLLSANNWNPLGLLYVIGIPFTLLLPGFLTLGILRLGQLDIWARTVLAVGLSVFEIIALSLVANWIMPLFGFVRPLDTTSMVWVFSTFIMVLLVASWQNIQPVSFKIPRYIVSESKRDALFIFTALFFVLLSILGAKQINDGGSNAITMFMLLGMGIYSVFVLRYVEVLSKHVIPTVLYFMSLALLFMTSLRGWFVTGHDIQREFFVFQLTKEFGVWNAASYVDAYNACLSITLLPTFLSNMLHMPDIYIYKVLFQMLFAVVLLVVYLISKTWLNRQFAFLAGLFFMAFPTFFQDMPFLVRQEIAFLFFGIMLYVLFEKRISSRLRQMLFLCMGVGVVLAHYSTTYTILLVLLFTAVTVPVIDRLIKLPMFVRMRNTSAVEFYEPEVPMQKRKITLSTVMILLLVSVLWTSIITGTDGHVREVTSNMWSAIQNGFDGTSRSPDVFVFFTLGGVQHERTLDEFVDTIVNERRADAPELFYETDTYEMYPMTMVGPTRRSETGLGAAFHVGDMSLGEMVTAFGGVLAKILQLAIPIGIVYVLLRRKWVRRIDREYYMLAAQSLVFIGLCILIPVLSREYGVFRAMQQSMFMLAPFMVVGTLAIGSMAAHIFEKWYALFGFAKRKINNRYIRGVAAGLGALFFLYATGFMGQLVGGNVPPVHLNNSGDDYYHYVTLEDEMEAAYWLNDRVRQDAAAFGGEYPLVQADRFGTKKLQAVMKTPISSDIYPGSIQKNAYVLVGPAITRDGIAVVRFEGSLIKYEYPLEFLESQKELVYSKGDVRIYK